jgi:hypothetical protein
VWDQAGPGVAPTGPADQLRSPPRPAPRTRGGDTGSGAARLAVWAAVAGVGTGAVVLGRRRAPPQAGGWSDEVLAFRHSGGLHPAPDA